MGLDFDATAEHEKAIDAIGKTLLVAWERVRANHGSRSAGVDGETAFYAEKALGVERLVNGLREELRTSNYRPSAVKQRAIPKRGAEERDQRHR